MSLISMVGDVGSGKTLFATYYATKQDKNKAIYSNYPIFKLPNYNDLKPEDLNEINHPSLIIVDEAYVWLESRRSSTPMSIYFTHILFQSRKREMEILLTDQLPETIDIRYRLMVNYEIRCKKIIKKKQITGFQYTVCKMFKERPVSKKKLFMPISFAEKIFPLYDTYQKISDIDDELIYKVTQDKTKMLEKVDEIVKILFKKVPNSTRITKGFVANYCIRNKLPKNFVDLIYNSIKSSLIMQEHGEV